MIRWMLFVAAMVVLFFVGLGPTLGGPDFVDWLVKHVQNELGVSRQLANAVLLVICAVAIIVVILTRPRPR